MNEEAPKVYSFGQDSSSTVMPLLVSLLTNRGIDPSIVSTLTNRGGLFNGSNDFIALILLFAVFGGGLGNFGFNNRGGSCGGAAVATDMIMQTLNRNGVDIGAIANALNTSTAAVQNGICNLGTQIATLSGNNAMNAQQIINSIQAGNTQIASQLAQCCCDNKLLATQQGYENRINNTEQTAILGGKIDAQTTMLNDRFCQAEMREMQNKIDNLRDERSSLMAQLSNEHQTAAIQGYVGSVVSPLAAKISAIEAKLPNTVTLPYSCATAVPTSLVYGAGLYGTGYNNGSIW